MYKLLINKNNKIQALEIEDEAGLILEQNNPLEFQFGKSFKTYTIKILNTPKNNLLLDNIFYSNDKDVNKRFDVLLEIDGQIIEGYISINKVKNDSVDYQFVSYIGKLWEDTLDKNLYTDFDWREYNHYKEVGSITSPLFNEDIIYDFALRGIDENDSKYYLKYSDSKDGKTIGLNYRNTTDGLIWDPLILVNYDSGSNYNHGLTNPYECQYANDITNRQPAIKVKPILEKIFNGYNINQNIWSDEAFDSLYTMFTSKDKSRNTDNFENENNVEIKKYDFDALLDSKTEETTYNLLGGYNSSTGKYEYDYYGFSDEFLNIEESEVNNRFVKESSLFIVEDWLNGNIIPSYGYRYNLTEDGSIRMKGLLKCHGSSDINIPETEFLKKDVVFAVEIYDASDNFVRTQYKKISPNNLVYNTFDTGYFEVKQTETIKILLYQHIKIESDVDRETEINNGRPKLYHYTFGYYLLGQDQDKFYINQVTVERYPRELIEVPENSLVIQTRNDYGLYADLPGNWVIPNVSVKEFLETFLKTFNLQLFFNKNYKTIYIENFDNNLNNINSVYDITTNIIKDSLHIDKFYKDFKWNLDFNSENEKFNLNRLDSIYNYNENKDEFIYGEGINNKNYKIPSSYLYTGKPEYDNNFHFPIILNEDKITTKSYVYAVNNYEVISGEVTNFEKSENEIDYPKYTTDTNLKFMFFNGYVDSYPRFKYSNGSIDGLSYYSGELPLFSNKYGTDYDYSIEGLFNSNFKETIKSINNQKLVVGKMYLSNDFLYDIYNFTGRDLRSFYYLDVDGFKGYYQIIKLNKQNEPNIYEVYLMRINDLAFGELPPQIASFNDDWNNSFNNEGLQDSGQIYYTIAVTSNETTIVDVSVDGQDSVEVLEGRELSVTVDNISDPFYIFSHWEDSLGNTISTNTSFLYTVGTSDDTLTAIFNYIPINYSVSVEPNNSIITTTGSGTYEQGTQVTINATIQDILYQFDYWSDINGNIISYNNNYIFTIYDDKKFLANYSLKNSNALG